MPECFPGILLIKKREGHLHFRDHWHSFGHPNDAKDNFFEGAQLVKSVRSRSQAHLQPTAASECPADLGVKAKHGKGRGAKSSSFKAAPASSSHPTLCFTGVFRSRGFAAFLGYQGFIAMSSVQIRKCDRWYCQV